MNKQLSSNDTLTIRQELQSNLSLYMLEKRVAMDENNFHQVMRLQGRIDATNEFITMLNEII